jgi:hypothetical protein
MVMGHVTSGSTAGTAVAIGIATMVVVIGMTTIAVDATTITTGNPWAAWAVGPQFMREAETRVSASSAKPVRKSCVSASKAAKATTEATPPLHAGTVHTRPQRL